MLTPEERRGALLALGLVLIGAAWDASAPWRPLAPSPRIAREPAAARTREAEIPESSANAESLRADRAGPGGAPAAPAVLSLNGATAEELETLPGIGPVMARRIVAHRERFGPFRSAEELRAVRGVGPRLMARLRGRLHTGP